MEVLQDYRSRMLADIGNELLPSLMLMKLPLLELLSSTRQLAPDDLALIETARRQAGRLSHLVELLLRLAQSGARPIPLQMHRADLGTLVEDVIAEYARAALTPGLRIALRMTADLPSIFADPPQLAAVLGILLDNACRYAPHDGVIRVDLSLSPAGDCLRLGVSDSGPGYPPELAGTLFQRFFRAPGPPQDGREGLSPGLSLAQELVELHGGRIGASSEVDGDTCFWFEVPLGSAHVARNDADSNRPPSGALPSFRPVPAAPALAGSLLLVESHPELAAYLGERLAEHCQVRVVSDARAAWLAMRAGGVAAIVSDAALPGRSGLDLCRRLRRAPKFNAIPMLLISSSSERADRQAGIDAGAQGWLAKPFTLEALFSALRAVWAGFGSSHGPPGAAALVDADANAAEPRDLLQVARQYSASPGFGVADWSALVHLSARQLRRRIGQLTGMSPTAWLRELRLGQVRERVLDGSSRSLAEAGASVGLDNPNYLYRLYRARFGGKPAAKAF